MHAAFVAATKFIGGHSDVTAGVLAVQDQQLADRIYFVQVRQRRSRRCAPSRRRQSRALRRLLRLPGHLFAVSQPLPVRAA